MRIKTERPHAIPSLVTGPAPSHGLLVHGARAAPHEQHPTRTSVLVEPLFEQTSMHRGPHCSSSSSACHTSQLFRLHWWQGTHPSLQGAAAIAGPLWKELALPPAQLQAQQLRCAGTSDFSPSPQTNLSHIAKEKGSKLLRKSELLQQRARESSTSTTLALCKASARSIMRIISLHLLAGKCPLEGCHDSR